MVDGPIELSLAAELGEGPVGAGVGAGVGTPVGADVGAGLRMKGVNTPPTTCAIEASS